MRYQSDKATATRLPIRPSREHLRLKPDDKNYPHEGPRVPKGETMSAKQNGDRGLELTYALKGKTLETERWELSEDGKNLTNTISFPGQAKEEVDVFDRE